MKKHKYIDTFHCVACFDKCIKRARKAGERFSPNYYVVSPKQYKACEKYGFPEGLLHTSEFDQPGGK